MEYNTPGRRLLKIREQLNLSQTAFARSLNLGQAAICHYENGNRKISETVIQILKEIYHVNPDYIKTGKLPMFLSADTFSFIHNETSSLSSEDRDFLIYYLQADDAERKQIRLLSNFKQ